MLPAGCAEAQTLAHRGWAGSGINVDPWWVHAVFYEIDPLTFQDSNGDGFGDLNGIARRLDYLQLLHVDAIVLSPFQSVEGAVREPIDPLYGTAEDFDLLEREVSLRHIRLVISLDLSSSGSPDETISTARFWLSRGVAGFLLTAAAENGRSAPSEARLLTKLRMLQKVCAAYAGDRVLISTFGDTRDHPPLKTLRPGGVPPPASAAHSPPGRRRQGSSGVQLTVDDALARVNAWSPFVLEDAILSRSQDVPAELLVSDSPGLPRSFGRLSAGTSQSVALAKMLGAVLLLGRKAPMLYFGQEIGMYGDGGLPSPMQWGGEPGFSTVTPWMKTGPNAETANVATEEGEPGSLLNWYRQLAQLRHDEPAVRGGAFRRMGMDQPDTIAWVWQTASKAAATNNTAVLVVCNASDHPTEITLASGLRSIGWAARAVHPVAKSAEETEPWYSSGVLKLPAFGVWVSTLRQPGLEAGPAPVSRRNRGRRS